MVSLQRLDAPVEACPCVTRRVAVFGKGRSSGVQGAVVVVTAAVSDVGTAIAEDAGAAGASVVVIYTTTEERPTALALVRAIRERGAQGACALQGDPESPAQAAALVARTVQLFGRLDVLVNVAPITAAPAADRLTVRAWGTEVSTEVGGTCRMITAALPHFIEQQGGTVVNVHPIAGSPAHVDSEMHAATKDEIDGYTKAAALALTRHHVTVNAICRGDAALEQGDEPRGRAAGARSLAARRADDHDAGAARHGTHARVARCARYLAERGQQLTGQTIKVAYGVSR
jgi:NAD(P)-dependent dehydrogenase (short-subunit alcohol dehydrogenase family)